MIVDSDLYILPGDEDDHATALEYARDLPPGEWDTLQAEVESLVDRALSFKDDLRSRLDEDEGRADEEEARMQAWEERACPEPCREHL